MEKKFELLKWWIGRQHKNGVLERTWSLSYNEYQHLLKCLKEFHNNKWRKEQNGNANTKTE